MSLELTVCESEQRKGLNTHSGRMQMQLKSYDRSVMPHDYSIAPIKLKLNSA